LALNRNVSFPFPYEAFFPRLEPLGSIFAGQVKNKYVINKIFNFDKLFLDIILKNYIQNPALIGSISRNVNTDPFGMSFNILATS